MIIHEINLATESHSVIAHGLVIKTEYQILTPATSYHTKHSELCVW